MFNPDSSPFTNHSNLPILNLQGLSLAPAQVLGSIRMVPLLRSHPQGDLRLFQRHYGEDLTTVKLNPQGLTYFAYVPYGLVLSWDENGAPVVANETQVVHADGRRHKFGGASLRQMERMAKREGDNQLRFLPMHLAMEGFLGMFFSGPRFAWKDYSKHAFSQGLGCRIEFVCPGDVVQGLAEALRVFEMYPQQVGVLVFVAEAFASAFVVPTPEDYRALHYSLLSDFYGDLIAQYSWQYDRTFLPEHLQVKTEQIQDLGDLEAAIAQLRQDWADIHQTMANGIVGRSLQVRDVYTTKQFALQRFITDLDPSGHGENYIGERIIRTGASGLDAVTAGDLEYLKLYRLSDAQTQRVYLLSQLDQHDWHLDSTAASLGCDRPELIRRLERAGWGYLLNNAIRTPISSSALLK